MSLYPRLRDHVRQSKEAATQKPWLIAEGFQPLGENDDVAKAKTLNVPSKLFIEATSPNIDLFLLDGDCDKLPSTRLQVRRTSNSSVFKAPHVLVAKGFTSVAFVDFDVSFRHALRGISGPTRDRKLLTFLAAYLRSSLARYYLFHTSSNWGISRQEVHVEELLRLPFPLPDSTPTPERGREIINEVARIVSAATEDAKSDFSDRAAIIRNASEAVEALIDEYFDVLPIERILVDDTLRIIIPSIRPTRARRVIPTIHPSTQTQRTKYTKQLCDTLNSWAKSSPSKVYGQAVGSGKLGVGLVILQKAPIAGEEIAAIEGDEDLWAAFDRLRHLASDKSNTIELMRGAKIFDHDRLFLLKPMGQRFWTETAALNDADEIAASILMHAPREAS
jgi:hypothetical protein